MSYLTVTEDAGSWSSSCGRATLVKGGAEPDLGMNIFADGKNFRIVIEHGIAIWTVWRRPDLDTTTGAELAEQQATEAARLVSEGISGMIFDLRSAPDIAGPRTQAAVGDLLAQFERRKIPVAVVVESPLQSLQFARLVAEHVPTMGTLTTSFVEAEDRLHERVTDPESPR